MSETLSRALIDTERLNELEGLIGIRKLQEALAAFREQLITVLAAVDRSDVSSRDYMLTHAHQLASSAGSLGFEGLTEASRFVLDCAPGKPGEQDFPIAVVALQKAIGHAMPALDNL
ncbi:MAG: Hpt domain-containing protein [Hyphomicrobiaceae bacterium]|nr:Hpt domain-containing protein [Hyphomicrobiaceae bacterium]